MISDSLDKTTDFCLESLKGEWLLFFQSLIKPLDSYLTKMPEEMYCQKKRRFNFKLENLFSLANVDPFLTENESRSKLD